MVYRSADIGALQGVVENLIDQLAGSPGAQGEVDRGIGRGKFGEDR